MTSLPGHNDYVFLCVIDAIEFLLSLRARCPPIFIRSRSNKMYHVTSLVRSQSNQLSVSPSDAALKNLVQSSLISVTPGTRIFKCDYISLYLHNWAVLRLCIVFSIHIQQWIIC